jgi:hypothetical protein
VASVKRRPVLHLSTTDTRLAASPDDAAAFERPRWQRSIIYCLSGAFLTKRTPAPIFPRND